METLVQIASQTPLSTLATRARFMSMRKGLAASSLALTLILTTVLGLGFPSQPVEAQEVPKGFACTFPRGASQAYSKGRYRSRPAKALEMEIGNIDLEGQRADLVTPEGKGTLRIVRALGANHYLEVVAEGYMNITTVYQRDAKLGIYPAVHSRHFGLFGEPLIAQYTGVCTAK